MTTDWARSSTVVTNPSGGATLSMLLAVIGQVFLLASSWLLPFVSEFDLVSDHISELVLGNYGFVQTIAFLASGVSVLALVYLLRGRLVRNAFTSVGLWLLALYGVGAILAGLFPTDRIDGPVDPTTLSTVGLVHSLVSLVSFLAVLVGMFSLTWAFSLTAGWRRLTVWSALLAGSALPMFLSQEQQFRVGLYQRALVTFVALWIIMVAIKARSTTRP